MLPKPYYKLGGFGDREERMPKVLAHEVPPFETPRACSVAATALGDETLLVGAEMVVQCLGEAAGEAEHGSL